MIDFDISEELRSIISELGYFNGAIIKITFTYVYNKVSFDSIFTKKNIKKLFDDFEKRIKEFVPDLSNHSHNLIENTIYDNLDKLEELNNIDRSGPSKLGSSIRYLRKYELNSILYEAIIGIKLPKFVFYKNGGTFRNDF